MKRYFFKTMQGRIVGLFVIFMSLIFAVSFYTIRYVSLNALTDEKEAKLLSIATYMDYLLGEDGYHEILAEAGAAGASREEKIALLNRVLSARTDEVAEIFPGLGVGYYSIELGAFITYGPSSENSDTIGNSIAWDHPGRKVMRDRIDLVIQGSMVRGHILNAMHPIVRGGVVIGYSWANELTSDIEQEYRSFSDHITLLLTFFYVASLVLAITISRRTIRNFRDIELLKAEAANAAQRDFLSRMSHEMRTPMNAVIGMTVIARQTDDIGKIKNHLGKINAAANHLLGVINDVLDISKIEAGKLELSETGFAVGEMIKQATAVTEFKINEKRQHFEVEIAEDVPPVIISDRQRLAQVIANLLSNANKFTAENGNIRLKVNCISNDGEKCRLRFEVKDDGIGISAEHQERLFQSFEQVDSSISRKYGGTGLGLAITKKIVEMMHGRIWIESELGAGASFIFEIDAGVGTEDEDTQVDLPDEKPEGFIFEGKHILLAEDVLINQEIVTALLEPTLIQIDCAENGAEALKMYIATPDKYDLIFMDMQMPEMDGFEATTRIRSSQAANAKTVPIIAMTANVFKDDVDKCLEAGMNGHVGKPLDLEEILRVLRKWL